MIYPRTISIYRPASPTNGGGGLQVGLVPYQGLQPSDETAIASGISASIQAEALGNTRSTGDIPSDGAGPVKWTIYVPKTALILGDVRDDDIVVDELGDRYQVSAAYWNILGYKIMTIRLKA